MKWIGQHIVDLIARFRSDVYMEDVSTGTIASGGNLGLDSNNKIVKANEATGDITGVTLAGDSGSASDTSGNVDLNIRGGNAITTSGSSTTITINHDDTSTQASVDNSGRTFIQDIELDTYGHVISITSATDSDTYTGDIAGIVIATDSGEGTAAEVVDGVAAFSILGTSGVGVTNSGTEITVTSVPGEIDHDSLLNFASNEHFTQANITTVGTIGSGTWQGDAVASAYLDADTAHLSGTQTFTGAKTFTDTVALTGTGQITGIDTVTNNTDAASKGYVDGKSSYAYMTWSASGTSSMDGSDPEWILPNITKGIYEEDWNKDENIKATSTGTTTYTINKASAVNGLVIPHAGQCVGFHAHGRNHNSDATFKAGLFHLEGSTTGTTNTTGVDYGNTSATHEATLRWVATADEAEASGGADGTASSHSFKGPCKLVSNTTALTVSAGDVLLPAIMGPDGSDEIFVTMTIILKIPIV